jgi:hypothetical protein
MSDHPLPYHPRYIQFWTVLSIILGIVLLSMFIFGDDYLNFGHVVWILIRWIFSPII